VAALEYMDARRTKWVLYEDWFERPQEQMSALARHVGPDLEELGAAQRGELTAYLDASLTRQRASLRPSADDASAPSGATSLYLGWRGARVLCGSRAGRRGEQGQPSDSASAPCEASG
jgi:hypothetical protein